MGWCCYGEDEYCTKCHPERFEHDMSVGWEDCWCYDGDNEEEHKEAPAPRTLREDWV